jgi:hypothetical protein
MITRKKNIYLFFIYLIAIGAVYFEFKFTRTLQIERWKYFIWDGEQKETRLIFVWNILCLTAILLYFLKSRVYEKYVAPITTIAIFAFLITFPFILSSDQKTKLATGATFINEDLYFMDFVAVIQSSACRFNGNCPDPKNLEFPYSDSSFIFQFVPIDSAIPIAFFINLVSIVILIFVVKSMIGISGVPIFLLSPWYYFVLERSNLDIIMLNIVLLLILKTGRVVKYILYLGALFLVSLKPIFAGFLLTNNLNRRNITYFGLGVLSIFAGYEFNIERIQQSRSIVDPTPFGAFGFSEIIELLRIPGDYRTLLTIFVIILIILATLLLREILVINKKQVKQSSIDSRLIFLLLVIFIAGNQVNYKLIMLFPLLLIILKIEMGRFQKLLILMPTLGLISIGQHTIMRGSLVVILTMALIIQVAVDFLSNIKKTDITEAALFQSIRIKSKH